MNKFSGLFFLPLLLLVGLSNSTPDKTDKSQDPEEQARQRFFAKLESTLAGRRKEISQEISTKYAELRDLALKLSKLEVLDYAAHITHELVETASKELEQQKDKKHAKEVAKLGKFTNLAVKEVESAKKEIDKEIKRITKKLNELLGVSRELLDKAHLQKAQDLIDQATKNLNIALAGIKTPEEIKELDHLLTK